jgi:NADP-dependent 3-hydroxy acid dehydrogenase YdfG
MDEAGSKRTLWVTGGGSGMGRAAAVAAAAAGWRVAVSGRRAEALEETAELVKAAAAGGRAAGASAAGGGAEPGASAAGTSGTSAAGTSGAGTSEASAEPALVLPLDVRDGAAVAAAMAQIEREWGRLDGLVLSAGLNNPRRAWADQSMADFDAIVDTNLGAVARVIDVALPALRKSAGTVVVISSYAGWTFSPGAGVAYSASKTALASVCRTLNNQEAASGVRACHLCPGDVDSEFLRLRPSVPDEAARSVMLSPDDVGRAVQFVLDSPAHVRIDELVITPVSQA